MQSGSEQPVHKQGPAIHILYLVQEDVAEVAVYLVEHLQHIVELVSLQSLQPLIVKIHIGKTLHVLQRLEAQGRLSASAHTDDNLGLRTVQFYQLLFLARAKLVGLEAIHFHLLIAQNNLQDPFVYNRLFHRHKDKKEFGPLPYFTNFNTSRCLILHILELFIALFYILLPPNSHFSPLSSRRFRIYFVPLHIINNKN